jgi:hypothetical protein
MTVLTFEPLIPGSLWLALAVCAVVVIAWYGRRRPASVPRTRWGVMTSLMFVAIAIVLTLLLNPMWAHEIESPAGKPSITVLLDASESMATPDGAGGVSRFAAASKAAHDIAESLGDEFDVHVETFDRSVKMIDAADLPNISPVGTATDLAGAIDSVATQEREQGQAMVLLSDGIHNAGGGTARVLESARVARSLVCPIFTRTYGGQIQSYGLAIDIPSPQDMAIVGQKLPLTARVTHTGIVRGRTSVTLLLDGKQVDRRDVLLDPNGPSEVHFLITHDKVGVYPYEVRVEPLPGQTSLANISASYALRVVDEPIRVLVLEGKPYWDSRFFIRTLAADPAVAINAVIRVSNNRLMDRTLSHSRESGAADQMVESWKITTDPKEPLSSMDKLRGYQIVVLGRDVESFLDDNAIANLRTWIAEQGGALVCYRGAPTSDQNDQVEKLLPVEWSGDSSARFHMELTKQGRDLDWLQIDPNGDDPYPRLPTLALSDSIISVKPLATVLASATLSDGAKTPVVVYHPYGVGRVVTVEGAGMWRWAFLPPEYQDQEKAYAGLWHSMMRWLTSADNLKPGQLVTLRADRVRFSTDEPATATLLARQDNGKTSAPMVELDRDESSAPSQSGAFHKVFTPMPLGSEPGVFRVNFGGLSEGRYQAKVSGANPDDPSTRIIFDVKKYDLEELDLVARPDLMQRIAEDSGGSVLSSENPASELESKFKQQQALTHPPQIEFTSAWDRWWLLVGAIALWGTSWAVRRMGGLI